MANTSWLRAKAITGLGALALWTTACGGGAASGGSASTSGSESTTATEASSAETATTESGVPDATRPVTVQRPFTASSGHALLVFLCPADCAPYAIVDASGAIVAEVTSHTRMLVDVAPGPVTFYAISAANADRISGEVTAGGVYYAAISAHSAGERFATISPQNPDGRWEHAGELVTDTHEVELDAERRPALDAHIVNAELRPRMAELDTRAGQMDQTHRDERTLHAEDGAMTAPGVH